MKLYYTAIQLYVYYTAVRILYSCTYIIQLYVYYTAVRILYSCTYIIQMYVHYTAVRILYRCTYIIQLYVYYTAIQLYVCGRGMCVRILYSCTYIIQLYSCTYVGEACVYAHTPWLKVEILTVAQTLNDGVGELGQLLVAAHVVDIALVRRDLL